MISQDQYYSICVNNNQSNIISFNNGLNGSQPLSNNKSCVDSKEDISGFGEGVVINAGFSILPAGMRTSFKAKFLPTPAYKSETGSARLSARITDFLKRSEHPFDERLPTNRTKSRNYSRDNSVYSFSNTLSLISLSGSSDSLTSLDKSGAISLVDDDIVPESSTCTDAAPENSSIISASIHSIAVTNTAEEEFLPNSQLLPILNIKGDNGHDEENPCGTSISRRSSTTSGLSSILGSKLLKPTNFEMNLDFDDDCKSFTTETNRLKRSRQDLVAMKKQFSAKEKSYTDKLFIVRNSLEKKCSEAVEDAETQREVAFKLKKELQSLKSEYADVKSLFQLETSKTTKLEERIRKAQEDQWKGNALLEIEQYKVVELEKEKVEAMNQAEYLRTELHRLKLDLHLKETRLSAIEVEMSELSQIRAEEAAQFKSLLQSKLKKQEEEFELLAEELNDAKVAKQRVDEQFVQLRRKHKIEIERYQDELQEFKDITEKKLKGLEFQLAAAEDEKAILLKSKKDLETKLVETCVQSESQENLISVEEINRLRKELKCTKALLKHTQVMAEDSKTADLNNKSIIRQLKNSLEQSHGEKNQLLRLRAKTEDEYLEKVHEIEDVIRSQTEIAGENKKLQKENLSLQIGFENASEELADTQKKYQSTLEELGVLKSSFSDQITLTQGLNKENGILQERILQSIRKIKSLEEEQIEIQNDKKKVLHLKQGQLRSVEKMAEITKRRFEVQLEKIKSQLSSTQEETRNLKVDKKNAEKLLKIAVKKQREGVEEKKLLSSQLEEVKANNAKLQKQLEISISESNSLRVELKSSCQRIEEVKQAISVCNDMSDDEDPTNPITNSLNPLD